MSFFVEPASPGVPKPRIWELFNAEIAFFVCLTPFLEKGMEEKFYWPEIAFL